MSNDARRYHFSLAPPRQVKIWKWMEMNYGPWRIGGAAMRSAAVCGGGGGEGEQENNETEKIKEKPTFESDRTVRFSSTIDGAPIQ